MSNNNEKTSEAKRPDADEMDGIRKLFADLFSQSAKDVDAAIDRGPVATARTLMALSDTLAQMAETVALVGAVSVLDIIVTTDCGNPDCPVHGKRRDAPASEPPTAPETPAT